MLIETVRFGVLDVIEDQILTIEGPVPPFDMVREYVLLPHSVGPPFNWLQAVRVPGLAFIVAPPEPFFKDYPPPWELRELESVGARQEAEALTLVILNPQKDRREVTANLLAPLLIGRMSSRGRQVILRDTEYDTQAPVLGAEWQRGGEQRLRGGPPERASA